MLSRLRYDMLLHRGRGPESLSQGVTPQIGLLEPIFGPIAIESPSEAVENGLNYYSKLSLDSKSNCNYSNYGRETVTIVSHRPRFCRQTFELDSGDPSETFALLLRGRAEILKRSSLIKRNSADFGVIRGLSAVITVIKVTFAIER